MGEQIYFTNRVEAGQKLAELLEKYRDADAVVLALPRGGVIPARAVAKALNLPLGIIVVRKIGHPQNPEYAIAAVSESNQVVKNEIEVSGVDPIWFGTETLRQLKEAQRRRHNYWGDRPPIDLEGKIVIIVDDGLATGLTMMAAIAEAKSHQPKKIVVAVPVAASDTAEQIRSQTDEFVAVSVPDPFMGGVGLYYREFPQVSDAEVIVALTV
ncbi:phosphoribosyl transferase [Patescibacteria group bacterium]|nr:phosphoribosyl transferase [Patescibacteria group bacterium]